MDVITIVRKRVEGAPGWRRNVHWSWRGPGHFRLASVPWGRPPQLLSGSAAHSPGDTQFGYFRRWRVVGLMVMMTRVISKAKNLGLNGLNSCCGNQSVLCKKSPNRLSPFSDDPSGSSCGHLDVSLQFDLLLWPKEVLLLQFAVESALGLFEGNGEIKATDKLLHFSMQNCIYKLKNSLFWLLISLNFHSYGHKSNICILWCSKSFDQRLAEFRSVPSSTSWHGPT